MASASRNVVENIRRVLMYVKLAVMVRKHAPLVRPFATSAALTRSALRNAMNHARLVQRRVVCLPVHIVRAPCLALPHAIMYHALGAARGSWLVVINVRLSVGRVAPTHASARLAGAEK
jgi:hypothetical protein